jgi:Chaperone of endosialidase
MAVPYTFGSATTSIPLSQLDSNFATTITLGNTAIQLGNTVTTLNNMTLANVTISSGTSNITSNSISNGTSNVTIASSGGAIAMATNGATAVTIDTSQNVGIGTSSPAQRLEISKGASGGGSLDIAQFTAQDTTGTGATNARVIWSGKNTGGTFNMAALQGINTVSNGGDLAFQTTPSSGSLTERARISSGGDFYIANTTVDSTHAGWVLAYNGGNPFINHCANPGGTSLTTYYAFINGNGAVGTIKTTGSSTQFNTSSDVRLKKNVVDAPSAIASIQQIGIKSFDWKADDLHQDYGVIAQELDAIAPEAVSHGGTEDEMWGVDYSKLVPRMIKAMQEQAETINALTARIVALEAK